LAAREITAVSHCAAIERLQKAHVLILPFAFGRALLTFGPFMKRLCAILIFGALIVVGGACQRMPYAETKALDEQHGHGSHAAPAHEGAKATEQH
jgi:hypothetical protein